MYRIMAKLPASYTFTGNARQATFGVTASANLETHVLSHAGADIVTFKRSNVKIVRARLVPSGAVGLAPAKEKIAARIALKFVVDGNDYGNFILSFSKWDEWERQDVSTGMGEYTDDEGELAVVQSGTEFTCDDFNVAESLVGQTVVPMLEIEMECDDVIPVEPIAANTLRFKFSKNDYDPTVAGVGSNGTWKKVSAKFHNVWDWTASGTSFANAFDGAFGSSDNIVSVIAAGDTSAVTNMGYMFQGCTSLTNVPLFDTSAVTDMSYMFRGCTSLTNVPLFDTSAVTNMSAMFQGCTSLANVPLFDTSAVTDMKYMFRDCTSLTNVPLFDTSAVTDMQYTFAGCTSLTSIPLFDTSAVTNMRYTFAGCTKVEGGALALYQQASTQSIPPSEHERTFDNCGKDTVTGAAELAQIPESWGGTLQEP